ncbi:MAG: hypothetical protein JOY96_08100 [Verrucomicrobia bacterium]|nr:hypothetical protein [Verrucomicrobiota bacterium]MBV9673550.1 hypothetical protein [Verrucomicrobiota bacterium]
MEPGSNLEIYIQRRLLAASGYSDLGLFQEAVEELESLPAGLEGEEPILVAWLQLYQGWEKWAEASSVARKLIEIRPENSNWPVALAYATRRIQGMLAAREILLDAMSKFPTCAVIHFNLACYAAQRGLMEEANVRLKNAIDLDPQFDALAKTDPDLEPLRQQKIQGKSI